MTLDNLMRYCKVGRSKTVTISCENCDNYTGYVRTITIRNECQAIIEFDVYGYDEAGITYFLTYPDRDTMIQSLEEYLGERVENWEIINQTGAYPAPPQMNYDLLQTHKKIEQDFLTDQIMLPACGEIRIKDGYWKGLYCQHKEQESQKSEFIQKE